MKLRIGQQYCFRVIFWQGDEGRSFFKVKIFKFSPEGKEQILQFFSQGEPPHHTLALNMLAIFARHLRCFLKRVFSGMAAEGLIANQGSRIILLE